MPVHEDAFTELQVRVENFPGATEIGDAVRDAVTDETMGVEVGVEVGVEIGEMGPGGVTGAVTDETETDA